MAYKYFPQTDEDIREMLARIGVGSLDDLYAEVPDQIRFKGDYQLPEAMSEVEVRQYIGRLADNNHQLVCFAGAGVYDHYTPSAIPSLIERSEFLTSYTPYQAEISQGTLHYIFEYQSMMSELTGMDISNASMYDGTTATAEAVLMANASSKKSNRVLVSETLDPKTRAVVDTYAHYHGIEIVTVPAQDGVMSRSALDALLDQAPAAGVVVQQPNRYGIIEDYSGLSDSCHAHKSLLIMNSIAADLALLKTPGEWGADIAVGDGQSLGIPMTFGGPSEGPSTATGSGLSCSPCRLANSTSGARKPHPTSALTSRSWRSM